MAQHVKGDRKTVHPLFEQRLDRLRRHVAAGKAGAAGGDDDIDAGVGDPSPDDDADRIDVVDDDLARRQRDGRPPTSRSASVVPDLSSASERVSEIVSTAMLSGMKALVSSMEDMVAISLRVPDAVQLS